MSDDAPKKWFTEAEAAAHVDVKPEDLRELREKKTGPSYAQKGPLIRYALGDLDKWVASMFQDADPDNSEGWEVVEPIEKIDVSDLYKKPAPPSEASRILGPDGKLLSEAPEPPAVTAMPFTRGAYDVVNQHGVEVHCPDPFAGLDPSQIAGVRPTPEAFLQNPGAGSGSSPLGGKKVKGSTIVRGEEKFGWDSLRDVQQPEGT